MHIRRGFTVAVISGLVISVLVGAGLAAEPPMATPLPDAGNGSRANDIVIDVTSAGFVAGQATTAAGRTVPVVWGIDPDDGGVTLEPLPVPASAEGVANGILIDVTSAGVVVGTVTGSSGVDHAVVWRQTAIGGWTGRALPDTGNGSRANGIVIDVIGAGVVVGSATGAGGVERAVIWREDGDGSWRGRPLPGGINGSRANGIVIDFTGAGLVAGQATTAAGRTVPMVWRIDPDDGSATAAPLPIPAAAEGTANGILIDVTSAGVVAGTVTGSGGVDHAVVWRQTSNGDWTGRRLPDAGNGSRANGILIDFTSAGLVAGDVTGPNGRTVPVLWEMDLTDGSAEASRLQVPSGAEGTANAIIIDITQAGIVAGTITGSNGVDHAVIWR